ncbi:MAG: hypothetical protein MUD06_09010 [Rhodospirillales bacterium]|jgi:hypothetical protein|nr:hypothetical protein [Rhodospirillales bacterium]
MEGLDVLNIVAQLVDLAKAAMSVVSTAAVPFALTIAFAVFLFSLGIRLAQGAEGISGGVIEWIVHTGLVVGAVTFWPLVVEESYNTAQEVSVLISGHGISGLDIVQRGYDLFIRVVEHGVSGAVWNPLNWTPYLVMVVLAFVLFLVHILLSFIVAAAVLQFWIGAAAVGIVVPFALVRSGLGSIGYQAMAFIIACVVRLIAISAIMAFGDELATSVMIPDAGAPLTLLEIAAADLTVGLVAFLAWKASSWASQIARASPGGTGVTALVSAAVVGAGRGGAAMLSGGAVGAGGAGQAAGFGGGGGSGGSTGRAAATAAGGSAGRGSGRVGRKSTP